MSTNTSKEDQRILISLLQTIQDVIHDKNPFVKDLIQVNNLPQVDRTIVISAKVKPKDEHERTYNEQVNLGELRIVTN